MSAYSPTLPNPASRSTVAVPSEHSSVLRKLTNPSDGADPAYALSAVIRAEARLEAARKVQTNEE